MVRQLKPDSDAPGAAQGALSGIVYYLPQTVMEVDLSFRVTKCDVEATPLGATLLLFDGTVSAGLKTSTEPDPSRGFVIAPKSMDGAFWRSDLVVELSHGVMKSLNAATTSEWKPPAGSDLASTIQEIFKVLLPKDHAAAPDAGGPGKSPRGSLWRGSHRRARQASGGGVQRRPLPARRAHRSRPTVPRRICRDTRQGRQPSLHSPGQGQHREVAARSRDRQTAC